MSQRVKSECVDNATQRKLLLDDAPPPLVSISLTKPSPSERITRIRKYFDLRPAEGRPRSLVTTDGKNKPSWNKWSDWENFQP